MNEAELSEYSALTWADNAARVQIKPRPVVRFLGLPKKRRMIFTPCVTKVTSPGSPGLCQGLALNGFTALGIPVTHTVG